MLAIKNAHGLWYSGDQTYGNTPVFLLSTEFRTIYNSVDKANVDVSRLKQKGNGDLTVVRV